MRYNGEVKKSGNLRRYILLGSLLLATGIYLYIRLTDPLEISQVTQLTQIYGLIAILYLYFTLLVSPLTRVSPLKGFNSEYKFAAKALGISAFVFALLHTLFAFFGELDGFYGLGFLDTNYIVAVSLSLSALLILAFLTSLSVEWVKEKLPGHVWHMLQKLIYIASLLILVHLLILGSHFSNLADPIPQVLFIALAVLLGLEGLRLDGYLSKKYTRMPQVGISFSLVLVLLSIGFSYLLLPEQNTTTSPLNVHAAHIALAKLAQSGQGNLNIPPSLAGNPAFIGDRTLRYTASFSHPADIEPNQDTPLDFQVFNASSGNEVDLFQFVYSKTMHLVIIDDELKFFTHIHPTQTGSHFDINTVFPHPGEYHLYLDFQPLGAIEQQFAFSVQVGNVVTSAQALQSPDVFTNGSVTKDFDSYAVTMTPSANPLTASDLSVGNQTITFSIKNATTGQGITTLKPYLAAFGHLVMVNEQTYDYIHVHPSNIIPPAPNSNGGPNVEFLPLGLYGPIKPGVYRVFAQFNPNNQLFTADFTIRIQ